MLLRDRLQARLAEMTDAPDYQALAAEILGIRNAPPELARRLVSQALVLEDRAERWKAIGERLCREAPAAPGVYILRDTADRVLYVGKANHLRRRLRTHFSARRWKALKADFARASRAEFIEVGSEIEALLREAALIAELRPSVNTQTEPPALATRAVPASLVRDVLLIVPSAAPESVELIGARADGGWVIQRTRRDGSELVRQASPLARFFKPSSARDDGPPLAPLVFSWLAGRGERTTRIDPHACASTRDLRASLAALLKDEELFVNRIVVRPGRHIR